MPNQIFISYRRDDAAYVTGHINDRLRKEFGDESIFTDVDNIALGVDFRTTLDQMVSQCQILLAVIGADWLTARNQEGQLRLQDPADFVRIEIESALKRNIPVIPLLVADIKMPSKDDLPDSLQDLAFRHATQIRPAPDFHNDLDRLINSLKKHLQTLPKQTEDVKRGHSASAARRTGEQELERLLAEFNLQPDTDEKRSGASEAKVQIEEGEKKRKQIELGISHRTTKKRWAAPLWVVGFLLVAGASWYFVAQYQEQVQATNAALTAIQKATADAAAKRQADADAEAKRQADADADAKRQADADADAKRQADADADAKRQADADAKHQADAEAKRQADADAEAKRQADADAEAIRQADADAEAKRQADAYAEAIRQAEADAEAKRQADAAVFIREGGSLAALGDHQAAIQSYGRAIRLINEPAWVYKQRGASHHALGDYRIAINDFDEAIRLNPEDANAYYSRSASYYALLDFEAAISDCDEAIRLDPEFANAYYSRGVSHHALGDYRIAINDFDEAIRLKPEFANAYYNRGVSHEAIGNYEAAERDRAVAAGLQPNRNVPR